MAPPKLLVNVFFLQRIDVVTSFEFEFEIAKNVPPMEITENFCYYPPPPTESGRLRKIYRVTSAGWPPPNKNPGYAVGYVRDCVHKHICQSVYAYYLMLYVDSYYYIINIIIEVHYDYVFIKIIYDK